jgi:photosystem II stability/assembly factor-like uncharacterized protein
MEARRLFAFGALALFLVAVVIMLQAATSTLEPEARINRFDRLSMIALVRAGDQKLVAAGERGRIVYSDDGAASWKVAGTPTHQTLTSLFFVDPRTGFATGHQGTLLRTDDGGATWNTLALGGRDKPALFAVRIDGDRGIAVGAYGAYYESADRGRTWSGRRIAGADFDRHLTGIAQCGATCYVIAGEAGTLLRSTDAGTTWQPLKSPYEGSFFGALGAPGGAVIVYGMRGNAYRSADAGNTWQRIDFGRYTGALQGASVQPDGSIVLTGADGFTATSRDGGNSFSVAWVAGRLTVSALLNVGGRTLCAGPAGLRWAEKLALTTP